MVKPDTTPLIQSSSSSGGDYGTVPYDDPGSSSRSGESDAKRKQSVLAPSTPINLSWESLNVSADIKKTAFCCKTVTTTKRILRNVNGYIGSGELVALMGASGAGKTTLLNTLTGRNVRNMNVSGSIRVNGDEIGRSITAVSAYVQQDDLFIPTMRVREHMIFQALLRLPSSMSYREKVARADEVIFELGLRKCANTKIGNNIVGRGISGGEAKRLAFASEVLTNPPLLFCDEPTTGLDSYMAENVVRVLLKMAGQGKTVVCTIHQPASEIYAMFDRVLLLAEGQTAFMGSTSEALRFFDSVGYPCPLDYNPADFYIQKLAIVPGKEEKCRKRVEKICEEYNNSKYSGEINRMIQSDSFARCSNLNLEDISKRSPYRTSWFIQFAALLWRCTIDNYRNFNVAATKIGQKIILGLFVGLIYFKTETNQTGITNLNGAMFFSLMELTFPAIFGVLTVLPTEFPVLVREHHNGMYRVSSYFISKIVSFIPVYSVDGIIFLSIAYFMTGLKATATAFFIAIAIGVLTEQVSASFDSHAIMYTHDTSHWDARAPLEFMQNDGTMLSAVSPSFPVALTIAGPILTLIQMTGGLFSNVKTLPVYLSWIQYISWVRYGFEAFAINQWHGIKNITCETPTLGCKYDGDEVLEQYSFDPTALGKDLGLMVALAAAFYLIGYIALAIRAYRAR